jgi:diaminopimelate decarboxylase
MHHFDYIDNELYCEGVSVQEICRDVGTPAFIYSKRTLERHFTVFREPFSSIDHLICYSMKACSNLAVVRTLANLGAGVDIVSGGELHRAVTAGVEPGKIMYSGVGKTEKEIDEALEAGILAFNVESEEELYAVDRRARALGRKAGIALRVNPDVDPQTHPYISTGLKKNKFGIAMEAAQELYLRARDMKGVEPIGVDCHIGSQLTQLSPFMEAADKLGDLINGLRAEGVDITFLDVGGGLGIPYNDEQPPSPFDYGAAMVSKIRDLGVRIVLEPGRVFVGNAGILVTSVLYQKAGPEKRFVIVDAAMNDLMRPTLYDAYHEIRPVRRSSEAQQDADSIVDVVGPICESGDFLARARSLAPVKSGDLLALMSAGAYGFSMSSNYNSRPRAVEILVDGDEFHVIRERESYEDLVLKERIPSSFLQSS